MENSLLAGVKVRVNREEQEWEGGGWGVGVEGVHGYERKHRGKLCGDETTLTLNYAGGPMYPQMCKLLRVRHTQTGACKTVDIWTASTDCVLVNF